MKLMVVFGTRPEVIKLAPVIAEARKYREIELITCSTGQHREMLDQALSAFGIKPDIELSLMQQDQTLPMLTARLIETLCETFATHTPDAVLVQGDTSSAFAAALAAFYAHIPVGHVEAGLRTYDLGHPFPEELNRSLIARMARWHFAPTTMAAQNLKNEHISPSAITLCGNTAVDAIELIRSKWEKSGVSLPENLNLKGREFVLVTAHRRENFGEGLENICTAIRTLCEHHKELAFVFPVHLNPKVQGAVFAQLSTIPNLNLTKPLDYETMLRLQSLAKLILTDSGGIQEEAPSFAVPTVVMRDHTERMEGVTAGFAILAGTSPQAIIAAAEKFLSNASIAQTLAGIANPYGDGKASARIIATLLGKSPEAFHG